MNWTGLKKVSVAGVDKKRLFIDKQDCGIPLIKQCKLIDLSCYYQSQRDNSYNEYLMRLIDEEYTKHPFYGTRQITNWLDSVGHHVNHKRVERLMQKMGIQGIHQKQRTSVPCKEHKVFSYLLGDMKIEYPNQVWATEITYIRMNSGWLYLVAIMDWYSRYVVSWTFSNTMDVYFCLEALENALMKSKPEILNSDQGAQFTSMDFIEIL